MPPECVAGVEHEVLLRQVLLQRGTLAEGVGSFEVVYGARVHSFVKDGLGRAVDGAGLLAVITFAGLILSRERKK